MLNPTRGLGFTVRRSPITKRKCRICKKVIVNPKSAAQKVHTDGKCSVKWKAEQTAKRRRKADASKIAKRARKRSAGIKGVQPARNREYLAFLRGCRCIVCGVTPCDPAHVGPIRGMRQKCPDLQSLPLCRLHHNAQHELQKRFWSAYSLDRDKLIAAFNLAFEEMKGAEA